jgi:hypothetical protein
MTPAPARLVSLLLLTLTAAIPLAAVGRPLGPRAIAPTDNYTFRPVTAFAGGRFLTIWHEQMGFVGHPVKGAFSDANGVRISSRSFAILPDVISPFSYDLVGAGDTFVLFWRDEENRMQMSELDAEGRIATRRTVPIPDYVTAIYAWNGTVFLAAFTLPGGSSASMMMFDREGRVAVPPQALGGTAFPYDIAVSGEQFVVLSGGYYDLVALSVAPSGIVTRTTVATAAGPTLSDSRPGRAVATVQDHGDVLVVWSTSSQQTSELKAAVLHPDGTRGPVSSITTATTTLAPVEVLRSGDRCVVAYATNFNALSVVQLDAAGAPLGQPFPVVTDAQVYPPAASSPNAMLVPYSTEQSGRASIAAAVIGADGQPRTSQILSLGFVRQTQPILGHGNGETLAAWHELSRSDATVHATAVDAYGETGLQVQLAPGVFAAKETGWNNTHHLLLYRDGQALKAMRVAANGTPADAAPIEISSAMSGSQAGVVWAGTQWVVVWPEGHQFLSATVSRDGVPTAPRTLDIFAPVAGAERALGKVNLAYDGSQVLLVWTEALIEPCPDLCLYWPTKAYATRLTRNGAPFDQVPVDLDVTDAVSISAASSGTEFLVVADQHAGVLGGNGELRVNARRELFPSPATSDVAWDGANYIVALRYAGTPQSWYSGVLRLDRLANDAAVPVATRTLTPDSNDAPSIAPALAGDALVGVHEGTAEDGISAVVYLESDMAPRPSPPGPPLNVSVRRLSPSELEIVWNPPAEGIADSYIIEIFNYGRWERIASATATARRVVLRWYLSSAHVRVRAFNAGGPSAVDPSLVPQKRRSIR